MSWREDWAGHCGRLEHDAGRLIAIPIIATIVLLFLKQYKYALWTAIIVFVLWIIYLLSHTLEKKFYGPGLRK